MLHRTRKLLSKAQGRTIVRDPRKTKPTVEASASSQLQSYQQRQPPEHLPSHHQHQQRNPLLFEPTSQNQQSIGSSMASYAFAGVGVALGFAFVRVLFGGWFMCVITWYWQWRIKRRQNLLVTIFWMECKLVFIGWLDHLIKDDMQHPTRKDSAKVIDSP